MSHLCSLCLPLVGLLSCCSVFAQEGGFVLDHYVGKWKSEFRIVIPGGDGDSAANIFRGEVVATRVVGGKFVEQTGTYDLRGDSPLVIKTIMGFDATANSYPYAYFYSNGDSRRSAGSWDSAKKTMTSKLEPEPDGSQIVITADFSTANEERWAIEVRNASGEVTLKVKGINRRTSSPHKQNPNPGNVNRHKH